MSLYAIDVVGTCNLKCPSCGRREKYTDLHSAPAFKGLMDYNLFLKVLDRIEQNHPNRKQNISLYVWGEPLMHNRIGDMIAEIRRRGWEAGISTNGNAVKHLESAIKAKPTSLSISVSGFEKATYNATHYKGDVDTVTSTIFRTWNFLKRYSPDTDFLVHYHLYKDNGGENLATLQRILSALKCDYLFSVGQILALDDVLDVLERRGNLGDEKTDVLSKLIFSPQDWQKMALEVDHEKCQQIEGDWLVINADGSVRLCCVTFGDQYQLFPSYLDTTEEEIFAARRASSVCKKCIAAGVPFAGEVAAHSAAFRKRVNEVLVANDGIKYVECRSLGVKNHLTIRGSLRRHIKTAIQRRISTLKRRFLPVSNKSVAMAKTERKVVPSPN